jgi:hypothetical protein
MLEKSYDEAATKKTHVYEWHKHFCDEHETEGLFCTTTRLRIGP